MTGSILALLLAAGCTTAPERPPQAGNPAPPTSATTPAGAPALDVAVVADGLDHPWDVVQAPDGTLLVDERSGGFTAVLPDGAVREVRADLGDLFATGETGLMGLALDPDFATGRRLYSCQGRQDGSIGVVAWTVGDDWGSLSRVADPLVAGLPLNERSGRHGGCRLEFAPDGALLIGTGDTADGRLPQDPGSLGGKVLRADAATGAVEVWTLGHRNVQGLAVRPGTGQVIAVEHGPDRDDEVNLLQAGGNYGWDPDGGGGAYDEGVQMTDPGIPGAIEAVWSSGAPTLAPSGATFLDGDRWGAYDGLLLVALLKARGVLALQLDDAGVLQGQFRVPEFDAYGRVRTVRQGIDGALYAVTDNGGNSDVVLRVTPGR